MLVGFFFFFCILREGSLVSSGGGAAHGQQKKKALVSLPELHRPSLQGMLSKWAKVELRNQRDMWPVEILIGCWALTQAVTLNVIQKMLFPQVCVRPCLPRLTIWHTNSFETEYGSILLLCPFPQKCALESFYDRIIREQNLFSEQLSRFLLKFVPLAFTMSSVWCVWEQPELGRRTQRPALLVRIGVTEARHSPSTTGLLPGAHILNSTNFSLKLFIATLGGHLPPCLFSAFTLRYKLHKKQGRYWSGTPLSWIILSVLWGSG